MPISTPPFITVYLDTPLLPLTARFDDTGLASIGWNDTAPGSASVTDLNGMARNTVTVTVFEMAENEFKFNATGFDMLSAWVNALKNDLNDFFNRILNPNALRVPLSIRETGGASVFRRAVWDALRGIPAGHTLSYGQIADRIGKPGAARAVGGACRANRWLLLIPCHRAVGAGGRLGGFGGARRRLDIKRRLLLLESGKISQD